MVEDLSEYENIISLGNSCCAGLTLRKLDLKKEGYPFDWVRSNPKIIFDFLKNGPNRFLSIGIPSENISNDYEIKDMFEHFYNKITYNNVNFYGQHFTHWLKTSENKLIEKFERVVNRFFNKLETSNSILFFHTTENYLFHKLSRDNKDSYYEYLIKISEFIEQRYPNLKFKIINIEIDNHRNDTIHIINYNMNIDPLYGDECETSRDDFLIPFRDEVTRIIKDILLPETI